MAEDLGTAEGSATRITRRPRSNWLLDAIMAGAGVATVAGPIAGIGAAIGRGIMSRRLDQSQLDQMAQDRADIEAANQDVDKQLQRMSNLPGVTDIDREQLNTLQTQRQILARMMNSSDPNARAQAQNRYLELMDGADSWLNDVESRQEGQQDALRGTYSDAFKDLRERFRGTQDTTLDAKRASNELLSFIDGMSDAELNKPFNRQRIAALMDTSARAFNVDTPDVLDAAGTAVGGLSGAAAATPWGAVAGAGSALVQGLLQGLKAEDFKIKGSEVRRVAMKNIQSHDEIAQMKLSRYGEEARALSDTGKRFGIVADDDSVFSYVTGQSDLAPISAPAARSGAESQTPTGSRSRTTTVTPRPRIGSGPSPAQSALLGQEVEAPDLSRAPDAAAVLNAIRSRRPTND